MTNTKFTPGPWEIGPRANVFANDTKKNICTNIANPFDAAIIAAAPDLYAALSEAKLQIEYLHEKFAETGSGNSMLAKIDAALAKARGEWPADEILKREG